MLIGVLHSREDPNTVSRIYTLAAIAKLEGVDLCYFSPGKIDFDNKKINGYYYEGKWKQKEYPYPDIVINTSRMKSIKQKQKRQMLKKEVLFTESKIHNKRYIQTLLENNSEFSEFLPDSIVARSKKRVRNFIDNHLKVVLKPSVGSKGERIIFISKENGFYKINSDGKEDFVKNINNTLSKLDLNEYLVQEFITSETNGGLPVDFRVHTQKDGEGIYVISNIYPRIGDEKYKVTNISKGGYSANLNYYLRNQFKSEWIIIYEKLKSLGLHLSEFLDEHYNNELNQLGIDICIDKFNRLFIIEVNWRPGSHIVFSSNNNNLRNLIRYCIYKVNKNRNF